MSDLILGLNCSRMESILPSRPSLSDVESLNHQLPALPNFLEPVVCKMKDCNFHIVSALLAHGTGREAFDCQSLPLQNAMP